MPWISSQRASASQQLVIPLVDVLPFVDGDDLAVELIPAFETLGDELRSDAGESVAVFDVGFIGVVFGHIAVLNCRATVIEGGRDKVRHGLSSIDGFQFDGLKEFPAQSDHRGVAVAEGFDE